MYITHKTQADSFYIFKNDILYLHLRAAPLPRAPGPAPPSTKPPVKLPFKPIAPVMSVPQPPDTLPPASPPYPPPTMPPPPPGTDASLLFSTTLFSRNYEQVATNAMPNHRCFVPYHTIPYHTIPYHTIPYVGDVVIRGEIVNTNTLDGFKALDLNAVSSNTINKVRIVWYFFLFSPIPSPTHSLGFLDSWEHIERLGSSRSHPANSIHSHYVCRLGWNCVNLHQISFSVVFDGDGNTIQYNTMQCNTLLFRFKEVSILLLVLLSLPPRTCSGLLAPDAAHWFIR